MYIYRCLIVWCTVNSTVYNISIVSAMSLVHISTESGSFNWKSKVFLLIVEQLHFPFWTFKLIWLILAVAWPVKFLVIANHLQPKGWITNWTNLWCTAAMRWDAAGCMTSAWWSMPTRCYKAVLDFNIDKIGSKILCWMGGTSIRAQICSQTWCAHNAVGLSELQSQSTWINGKM